MILQCPSCDSRNVTTMWTEHTFPYEDVNLMATVPLRQCGCCGEYWLDHLSEAIIDSTIKDFEDQL